MTVNTQKEDAMKDAPQWAKDLMAKVDEVAALQDKWNKPAPQQEAQAQTEETYSLGFWGDVKASSVPEWSKDGLEREQAAIGSNYDFVDALEKDQPDKYSRLREHIASVQADFKAANAPDRQLTDAEIATRDAARERAMKAMGDRMVAVSREEKIWR